MADPRLSVIKEVYFYLLYLHMLLFILYLVGKGNFQLNSNWLKIEFSPTETRKKEVWAFIAISFILVSCMIVYNYYLIYLCVMSILSDSASSG